MQAGSHAPDVRLGSNWDEFLNALEQRRALVYDYLVSWPGAAQFAPAEIHDALYSYINRGGKALRPLLLLLSCGAVGGDESQALPAAAAVEVYQTWTLVHDDIIDRDDMRRGGPTVHAQYAAHARQALRLDPPEAQHYGTVVGLLAGDLQQSWSYALLADLESRSVSPGLVLQLIRRMASDLTPRLLHGEMLDVQYALEAPEEVTEEQVLQMLGMKTAALLEYAAWCGGMIGIERNSLDPSTAEALGRFAFLCGVAFQIQDDLLGITSDERTLGKPVGSDLREGKRTLVMQRALRLAAPADRDSLLSVLGNQAAGSDLVAEAIGIVRGTGAVEAIAEEANALVSQALELLDQLPDTPYRSLLASWARFTLARHY